MIIASTVLTRHPKHRTWVYIWRCKTTAVVQDANLDEGDEIAAEAVQDAILGHTDSKNRCPKKKSFELNASRATSRMVEH